VIRILLVDDQALVRAGFRMILDAEPQMEVVGEARDGREAIDQVRALSPDVVLMDIRMPELDGLEATRRILEGGDETTKILMLTTFDLDEYVYEALRAGASGFLLKDTPPEQLVAAIEVISRGDALLSPTITRRVISEFVK
jgi:DNA-binding NarL/FixJ family response regulator